LLAASFIALSIGLGSVLLHTGGLAWAAAPFSQLARSESGSLALPAPAPVTAQVEQTLFYEPFQVTDPSAYVYAVRMGESWHAIANRFGVSFGDLQAANAELWDLRGAIVHPLDQMAIPSLDVTGMVQEIAYEVQPGDSWRRIADTHGIFFWDLRLDNASLWQHRGVNIQPGDLLTIRNSALAEPVSASAEARMAEGDEAVESAGIEVTEAGSAADDVEITGPLATAISLPLVVSGELATGEIYNVRPGDSWYAIAGAKNLTFAQLRAANPEAWRLRGANLRIGDQLVIPARDETPEPPGIRQDEENAGDPAGEKPEGITSYVVLAGESWESIAEKLGLTVDALQAANGDLQEAELVEGTSLRLP
jgi:LysM repeat protein